MHKSRLLIAALVLACCALVTVLAFMVRPVSDASLAIRFTQFRVEMDRLVSILATNPSVVCVQRHDLSNEVVLVVDDAGRSREASEVGSFDVELRRLFDAIGCDYASQHASEFIISFRRNGVEDFYPGGFKVFAFRSTQPAFVVSSIDDFRRANRGKYGIYQPLEGSWYIKYEEAH